MIRTFLFGLSLGAIVAVLALQYHLIHTSEGLIVVPRTHQAPLRSAYVDARGWTPATWQQFPDVTAAMIKSGRADIMQRTAAQAMHDDWDLDASAEIATRQAFGALLPPQLTQRGGQKPAETTADSIYFGAVAPAPTPAGNATAAPTPVPGAHPGLPILERPVPLPRDSYAEEAATPVDEQAAASPASRGNWMKGLLKSLAPDTTAAAQSERHAPVASAESTIPEPIPSAISVSSAPGPPPTRLPARRVPAGTKSL